MTVKITIILDVGERDSTEAGKADGIEAAQNWIREIGHFINSEDIVNIAEFEAE